MQSGKNVFLEPVRITTKGQARQRVAYGSTPRALYSPFEREIRSGRYFFDRVVRKNEKDFERINVNAEIELAFKSTIEKLNEKLRKKLETMTTTPEIIEQLFPFKILLEKTGRIFFDPEDLFLSQYYFYKHNPSIVIPSTSNTFYILSKSKDEAVELLQFIKSECEKLSEVTKDFGLELNQFLTGRDYQESLLRNFKNIQSINYKKPKDEFEEKIIHVCEETTSSYLSNVEVAFTEPVETFEFDIFVGVSEDVKTIIEPTDYERVKDLIQNGGLGKDTLKSKIILGTQDKAQRLGAKSVVIAKGFPEEVFVELKKIADSRRVTLLSEVNYENELPKIFWNNIIEEYTMRARVY